MTLLKAFINQINNLIHELNEILPYNKELEVNRMTIELVIKTNPRLILTAFNYYVYPYKQQIMEKNEDFFIDYDTPENPEVNQQILQTFNVLKRYWSTLTEQTKDTVWLYLQVLIKISDTIQETSPVRYNWI